MNEQDNGQVVGRRSDIRGEDREEEPEEEEAQKASLMTWASREPKKAVALIVVLFVPYLIICSGLAIAFARIMTVGTCGG